MSYTIKELFEKYRLITEDEFKTLTKDHNKYVKSLPKKGNVNTYNRQIKRNEQQLIDDLFEQKKIQKKLEREQKKNQSKKQLIVKPQIVQPQKKKILSKEERIKLNKERERWLYGQQWQLDYDGSELLRDISIGYEAFSLYMGYTIILYIWLDPKYEENNQITKKVVVYKGKRYQQKMIYDGMSPFPVLPQHCIENKTSKLEREDKFRFKYIIEMLSLNETFMDDWNGLGQSGVEIDMVYVMKPFDTRKGPRPNKKKVNLFRVRDKKREEERNKNKKSKKIKYRKVETELDLFDIDLYNELENSILANPYIQYKINPKAQKFGELFHIPLCDYVETNYRANSCFINTILSTYREPFNKLKPNGKRIYAELTYDRLLNLLGIENKNQDIGLSINDSLKFFETYRLGLDVMNIYCEMIFKYRPQKELNTNINPQVLRIVINNNHIHAVNHKAAKFIKINVNNESEEVRTLKINDRYFIRKIDPKINIKFVFVNTIEDITNNIKNNDKHDKIRFLYRCDTDLKKLLFEMVRVHKVIPNVRMEHNKIISVNFEIDGKSYYIARAMDNTVPEDNDNEIEETDYDEYIKQDNLLYARLMKREHMSDYPPDVLKIENFYQMGPSSGYFASKNERKNEEILDTLYTAVDMSKAYSSRLREINCIPIFGYFDHYQKYNPEEPINPYFMYIVKTKISCISDTLMFDKLHDRVYGFHLLDAQKKKIEFEIKYVRKYSRLETVNYRQYMDELYDEKVNLKTKHKKFIANKTIGLFEKKLNKVGITKVFHSYEEAQYYQLKFLGSDLKSKITSIDNLTTEVDSETQSLYKEARKKTVKEYIHLLYVYQTKELCEGFRQIKEMVYCLMKIKLHDLYLECKRKGLDIGGVKTDAVLVRNSHDEIKKTKFVLDDNLGGIKLDEKPKSLVNKQIKQKYNYLMEIPTMKVNVIKIKDEFNQNEFNTAFDNHNFIFIKSDIPGAGKSNSVKNYAGEKTLFVCPFNELALEFRKEGYHSTTVNKLLGMFGDGSAEYMKIKMFDISKFDVICFDEMYLNNNKMKKSIHKYMLRNNTKKYIATGDSVQNNPIGDDVDVDATDKLTTHEDIINQMFPNQINLTICKRFVAKTKDEQEKLQTKLIQLKEDILNLNIPIMDTMSKNFRVIDKIDRVKSLINITYSNDRSNFVNNHIHNNVVKNKKPGIVINGIQYYCGLKLRCCKEYFHKKSAFRLFTNYVYTIVKLSKKKITLKDEFEDEIYTIDTNLIKTHLRLPYCRTGHSVQGKTIKEPITIFEVNSPYVDRKWIWTAVTRCQNMKDITIFKLDDDEVNVLGRFRRILYFKTKIQGYKRQDLQSGRTFSDIKYVNTDWFIQQFKTHKCCPTCKVEKFKCYVENGNVKSNITADRIDNSRPHECDNIKICCVNCNRKRSNHY